MEDRPAPEYAVFDDYRPTQQILVWVRWVILLFAIYANNFRPNYNLTNLIITDLVIGAEILLNIYLHWQVAKSRKLRLPLVLVAASIDAVAIMVVTTFSETPAFDNPYFVAIFPIVIAYALVLPRLLALAYSVIVATCYVVLSLALAPGIDIAIEEHNVLVARCLMIVVVGAMGSAIVEMHRTLRYQAVEAERDRSRLNLELQCRAQQAEMEAEGERGRIAREIHDGIAQSIYMLSLNLEAIADVVSKKEPELGDRLDRLVKLSKQTLLETRHYIFDLKPLLSGDISLEAGPETGYCDWADRGEVLAIG